MSGSSAQRLGVALGLGGEQVLGVGVLRVGEQRLGGVVLLHLAVLHHIDIVGELADDGQVMGDQDHRHAVLVLEVLDQVEDLRLHGDVERGGRLVGDQHVGPVGERHGDHHALALAARQLVRILLSRASGSGICTSSSSASARAMASPAAHPVVQVEDFADLLADGIDRVQRAHRLLEDHRDVVAAQLAHLAGRTGRGCSCPTA